MEPLCTSYLWLESLETGEKMGKEGQKVGNRECTRLLRDLSKRRATTAAQSQGKAVDKPGKSH
jgi:hypothetical protein